MPQEHQGKSKDVEKIYALIKDGATNLEIIDAVTVDIGKTVFDYGMDCGSAEDEIHVGMVCTLASGLVTHAPVEHTGGSYPDLGPFPDSLC